MIRHANGVELEQEFNEEERRVILASAQAAFDTFRTLPNAEHAAMAASITLAKMITVAEPTASEAEVRRMMQEGMTINVVNWWKLLKAKAAA